MTRLDAAYEDCFQIINRHSKTFTKAFSLLPAAKRNAVWAVYAFCREVDDIVDEGNNPAQELDQFEETFERFLRGGLPLPTSKWIALQDVFERFDVDKEAFSDMIRGQRIDLTKNRYQTIEEMEYYAYHVASTVGLMLLPILAPNNHRQLRAGGIALGLAMQITNILRDVGEDLDRNRIYLPKDVMDKHGLTVNDLMNRRVNTAFINVWEGLAKRAEELYRTALVSIDDYPLDARLPVKGSAHMYRGILHSIRRNHYDVFGKRNFVTKEEKEIILMEMQA